MKLQTLFTSILFLTFPSISTAQDLKKEFIDPQAQEGRSAGVR